MNLPEDLIAKTNQEPVNLLTSIFYRSKIGDNEIFVGSENVAVSDFVNT
jgi:hypothetical protein